ncbi:MAG: transposase [Holophagales bacterium]|nr:transposase [Holophagales bacterium]
MEVTNRTLHGRFLIEPCPEVTDILPGILGRAMRRYQMRGCALVFMSSHFHLLPNVDDTRQLSRFMEYVGGNVAREIGRRLGWKEKIWARRFQAIPVSDEEEAQLGRLAYLLSHGIEEGLVSHPSEWPGLQGVDALLEGTEIVGHWYDRTKESAAYFQWMALLAGCWHFRRSRPRE